MLCISNPARPLRLATPRHAADETMQVTFSASFPITSPFADFDQT
jgi:hypothetical protein